MKYLISFSLLLVAMTTAMGQKTLRDNQYEGYIIMADGKKSDVAIEVEDASQPWTYQDDVKYYDRSLLNGSRVKRELKKNLIPGEVIEYGIGSRRFVHVNYQVKGKGDDVLKSTLDKIKGEKNMEFFAEIVTDGPIQLLKFYQPPVISEEEYDDAELVTKITNEAKETFDILIARGDIKPKSIQEINYKTFFEDCPFVLNKFDNKRYKIEPTSGIKKLLKSGGLSGPKLEAAANAIVSDFILKCSK